MSETDGRRVPVEPFDDWLVVTVVEPPDETEGGIALPAGAGEGIQDVLYRVERVGPGRLQGDGNRRPMKVEVGDLLLVKRAIAVRCQFQKITYWLVMEGDVVARVLEGPDQK